MSAIVYDEPYRLPAGILAVAVHGAFFALLYFGFTWQAQPVATMSVELWQSLPDLASRPPEQPVIEKVAPPPQPEKIVEPKVVPPPQPEKIARPEIVMPDKKKAKTKPVEVRPDKKKLVPIPAKKVEAKPVKREMAARIVEQIARDQAEQAALEQAERARTEQAAAIGRVVDEYTGKIIGKIRRNIVMPPDVPDDARAVFSVTVLPGGSVLPPGLLKSSGNTAYDSAVERAILKSQPLPLPQDAGLFNSFREMKLSFRPKE